MKEELEDFQKSFDLANNISQNRDKDKLIAVIEDWQYINGATLPIFSDLVESFGFYPYIQDVNSLDMAALIRNEYHKSDHLFNKNKKITFHFEQKFLEEKISHKQNLLVSAPTSFGKSLLIEEFVARKEYNNILIIQPTLALIDETRKKLKKYDDFYNIVVNTSQDISDNNLYILTSERVLDILPNIKEVDLFVVDEFYKISNRKKDDRASQLNIAFYKMMGKSPQLLLLTPNIDDVNREFIDKYSLEFFNTKYSLVNQDVKKIDFEKNNKTQELFNLLNNLDEPTIVYVQSPNQAEKLAQSYAATLDITSKRSFPIFEWIDENISTSWRLKSFLENGIGIHNGQYPRHVVNSQLEYFNDGELNVIFATTSLIEGVNTVAKNIVIYEMKKGAKHGTQKITYFDYNNIKGRAGRMMKYYTGNIFYFDTPPDKEEENLDIPIIEQDEKIQSEILVNLKQEDIKEHRKADYESLTENVPLELLEIFKNNYYNVESQKRLYLYLVSNRDILETLLWSTPTPKHDVLLATIEVINKKLDGQNGNSHGYLAQKCQQIMRNNLKQAVESEISYQRDLLANQKKSDEEVENLSIMIILKFIKNEAKYAIPKKLSVLESIVNYISVEEKADYSSFIALLEHEGIDEKLSMLLDFGVPASALKKLKNLPDEDTMDYIKINLDNFGFNKYELDILRQVI